MEQIRIKITSQADGGYIFTNADTGEWLGSYDHNEYNTGKKDMEEVYGDVKFI